MLESVGLFLWLAALELVGPLQVGSDAFCTPPCPTQPIGVSMLGTWGGGCRMDDSTSGTTFQVQIRSIYILPRT